MLPIFSVKWVFGFYLRMPMKLLFNKNPVFWAAVLSGCLAIYMLPVIGQLNTDGIFYLRVAQQFIDDPANLFSANEPSLYGWSFFSMLIALISHLAHISLVGSAQVLCVIFQVIIAAGFVMLIKRLDGSLRAQWIGLACLLTLPHLNDYRSYIIRDFGYWAGYIFSLWALLSFFRRRSWPLAFIWGLASLLGTLFRVEGILFWLILPWVYCFKENLSLRDRVFGFLQLNVVLIILLIIFLVFMLADKKIDLSIFSRLDEFNIFFHNGVALAKQHYHSILGQMQSLQTNELAVRALPKIFSFGLVVYLFYKIFSVTGFFFSAIILYGLIARRPKFPPSDWLLIVVSVFINMLVLSFFLGLFLFLSGRYVMALSLTLLIFLPFVLDELLSFCTHNKNFFRTGMWIKIVFSVFIVGSMADALISTGPSKRYLREAGSWLAQTMPAQDLLYTNSEHILFYARGAVPDWQDWLVDEGNMDDKKLTGYLALRSSHKGNVSENHSKITHGKQPIKEFSNRYGDKVSIWHLTEK